MKMKMLLSLILLVSLSALLSNCNLAVQEPDNILMEESAGNDIEASRAVTEIEKTYAISVPYYCVPESTPYYDIEMGTGEDNKWTGRIKTVDNGSVNQYISVDTIDEYEVRFKCQNNYTVTQASGYILFESSYGDKIEKAIALTYRGSDPAGWGLIHRIHKFRDKMDVNSGFLGGGEAERSPLPSGFIIPGINGMGAGLRMPIVNKRLMSLDHVMIYIHENTNYRSFLW